MINTRQYSIDATYRQSFLTNPNTVNKENLTVFHKFCAFAVAIITSLGALFSKKFQAIACEAWTQFSNGNRFVYHPIAPSRNPWKIVREHLLVALKETHRLPPLPPSPPADREASDLTGSSSDEVFQGSIKLTAAQMQERLESFRSPQPNAPAVDGEEEDALDRVSGTHSPVTQASITDSDESDDEAPSALPLIRGNPQRQQRGHPVAHTEGISSSAVAAVEHS